jgi:profilin
MDDAPKDAEKEARPAVDKAFADGVHVAGERYVAARIDGRSAYVRQVRPLIQPPPPAV